MTEAVRMHRFGFMLIAALVLLSGAPVSSPAQETGRMTGSLIDIYAGIPIVDLGSIDGLAAGDELLLLPPGVQEAGTIPPGEIALSEARERSLARAVVRRAYPRVAELQILEGHRRVEEGLTAVRVPRIGVETTVFTRYTQPSLGDVTLEGPESEVEGVFTSGVRIAADRRFFSMRPFVALELPYGEESVRMDGYLPLRMYAGGELHWYFRRVRVSPSGALGFGMLLSAAQSPGYVPGQWGGLGQIEVSYLLWRSLRLGMHVGGSAWSSMVQEVSDEIGFFFGVGLSIKG